MILFHGSNMQIDSVDLHKCRPFKDFGKGFYLTTIEDKARMMAMRICKIYGGKPNNWLKSSSSYRCFS